MYPGLAALRTQQRSSDPDHVDTTLLSGVVAGLVYPRAAEAFLSTAEPPPCHHQPFAITPSGSSSSGSSSSGSSGVCRCYERGVAEEGEGGVRAGVEAGLSSSSSERSRRHEPWEALEALRPTRLAPSPQTGHSTTDAVAAAASEAPGAGLGSAAGRSGEDIRDSGATSCNEGEEGPRAVDSLGAVLLLCEVLRCEGEGRRVLSHSITSRLPECCGWVSDHLAALFPAWVEEAVTDSAAEAAAAGLKNKGAVEGVGQAAANATSKQPLLSASTAGAEATAAGGEIAVALCDEASTALGLFVSRQALNGEFEEAQVREIGRKRAVERGGEGVGDLPRSIFLLV